MGIRKGYRRRWRIRLRMLAHDLHCYYCGGELTEEWSSIDHLQPRSRGGGEDVENFRLACFRCNKRKGSYDPIDLACSLVRGYGLHLVKHVRLWRSRWGG